MKKTILTVGIIGALFAINGYADNKMVAVYTCQNGCNVTNDKTNFSCNYPDGKSCGNAVVDIFVSQTSGTMFAPNAPQKSEPARSATVTARAAKKQNNQTTSNKPKPTGPDKASEVGVKCPDGCAVECHNYPDYDPGLYFCDCYKNGVPCNNKPEHITILN